MMQRKIQQRVTVILIIVLTVLVLLNSQQYFFRLDMTGNKIYSIAEVSKTISAELEDTLFITYYLSERLRTRAPETDQIVDLLYEYAAYGKGSIQVEIIDPVQQNVSADVEQLGVVPQQIQVIEEDQQSLAVIYTGIVIRYLGRHEVIPLVFDIKTLEYQLTSTIRNLVRDDPRIVALLTDGDERDEYNALQTLQQQLGQHFTVQQLTAGDPIPKDVDALLVFGSENFDYDAVYYINKYIMEGGPAMLCADGVDVAIDTRVGAIYAGEAQKGPFYELMEAYGFRIDSTLVLDKSSKSLPVTRSNGGFTIRTMIPYPHWVTVIGENVSKEHPVTSRFTSLDLFWASPLTINAESNEQTKVERILRTTDSAWLMKYAYIVDPQQDFTFRMKDTLGSYDLAATLTGRLEGITDTDAFPVPEDAEGKEVPEYNDSARVLFIGDSQFATDIVRFTNQQDNVVFVENIAEWLTNDEDLLQIRTRSTRNLRLNKDMEGFAARKFFAEWLNMLGIPLLVIGYGIFRMIGRRRKARIYTAMKEQNSNE